MELTSIFIIILLILIAGALSIVVFKQLNQKNNGLDAKTLLDYFETVRRDINENSTNNRKETQSRLDIIDEKLAKSLNLSSKTLQDQFSQHKEIIKEIYKELTTLKGTNSQILNFSEKLQSLENILKNPKQRGVLGEYFLEALLSNILNPNQFKLQYKFANGEIVDAVIFFNDKVIPIDAKFSLEKYNKIMEEQNLAKREQLEKEFKSDIKNRIDETSKYINPNQNTTEFAFMFIPAEGIYYNLLVYTVGNTNYDLIEYAFKKHVIIVSPTSFYAYLQTVLQGLKALKMENSVKEILKKVDQLGRHLITYEDNLKKLGNHLGTAVNAYNNSYDEFKKVDKDIFILSEKNLGGNVVPAILEKPILNEK